MIQIKSAINCCGCAACAQRCPQSCITMIPNEEGFKYPKVDYTKCINCHLCEKVCPINISIQPTEPIECWAMRNMDEKVVNESSSGGVFTYLANQILEQGGIVFGAKFDNNWNVVHDFIKSKEELYKLQTSKYVQSDTNSIMLKVEYFLKEGKPVLFVGTPCQIAGLKLFLRKEYVNLYLVEIVCHGVPSPKVWRLYLKEITNNFTEKIANINFRDKSTGWAKYSIKVVMGDKVIKSRYDEHPYMRTFLTDFIVRPSCYNCHFKSHKSFADITIGDYWGIDKLPDISDDNKGYNVVIVRTSKGLDLIKDKKGLWFKQTDSNQLFQKAIYYSASIRLNRKTFWRYLLRNGLDKSIKRFNIQLPFKNNIVLWYMERMMNKISTTNSYLYYHLLKLYFYNKRI